MLLEALRQKFTDDITPSKALAATLVPSSLLAEAIPPTAAWGPDGVVASTSSPIETEVSPPVREIKSRQYRWAAIISYPTGR